MALPRNKKLPPKKGTVGSGPKPIPPKGKDSKGKDTKGKDAPKGTGAFGKTSKFYGGVGGYKGVKTKPVKRLVNGVLRDEIRDLRKQVRAVKQDARGEKRILREDYRRGKADLDYVHGETGDYLNHLSGQNQQMFQQQGSQQQAAQAALQQHLQGTYSGAQQGAQDELARLGIQGGGSFQQLNADQANAQAVAGQSGANAQSTLGMAGANSAAALQMLQGMNQGSFLQGIGQNLNAHNDAMAEVRTNKINNLNEVRQAMQEARGSRRDMFFQLLQQLQQTGWDQYVQQQQLGMQRQQHNISMRGQRKALKKK